MATSMAIQNFIATTSSGWTAPAGVYLVLLDGYGAGGGGAGGCSGAVNNGAQATGGSAGGGALRQQIWVPVTPGTAYDITIGAGGTAGTGGTWSSNSLVQGTDGSDGGSTTFAIHGGATLATFVGGAGGLKGTGLNATVFDSLVGGGSSTAGSIAIRSTVGAATFLGGTSLPASYGGFSGQTQVLNGGNGNSLVATFNGANSPNGFTGGTAGTNGAGGVAGTTPAGGSGGAGGGAGPGGNGRNGGKGGTGNGSTHLGADGYTVLIAQSVSAVAALTTNTGCGGSGGGGGGCNASTVGGNGAGGSGGDSGSLKIIWFQ